MARGLITPDAWHHLRFSYNNTNEITWEVDGSKNIDKSISGELLENAGDSSLYIGRYGQKTFSGCIDELMILTGYNSVPVNMDSKTLNSMLDSKLIFHVGFDDTSAANVAKGQGRTGFS